jgi:hypothetical protein
MDLVSLPMIFSVIRSLKNGNLSEAAEQELFVTGLLEPGSGPAPQESQPDIGIKEIQGIHRCVRWSG